MKVNGPVTDIGYANPSASVISFN